MEFVWDFCEDCKNFFVQCPKCGNNCCNGGYGEVNGLECNACSYAYEYQAKSRPPKLLVLKYYDEADIQVEILDKWIEE